MTESTWQINELNEARRGVDSIGVRTIGPLLSGKATLHHLGFVVASISAAAQDFALFMSARWDAQIIHDPIQQV